MPPRFLNRIRDEPPPERLKIPFHSFDITDRFLDILSRPRYGYGKNLNPCVDCHRLMAELTFRQLAPLSADFIVSGEVLGQRPKSQNRGAMNAVAAGDHRGLLLRPLSALLLSPTIPEKEGWVDRGKLLGISGRSRRIQIALAEKLGDRGIFYPGRGMPAHRTGLLPASHRAQLPGRLGKA